MNQHEYIAGFYGVLIGFTLTELIKGVAETFKNSERVNYYYPHGLAILFAFFQILLNFFDFYQFFQRVTTWTPILLIRFSFTSIFVCFLSYLIFPSFTGEGPIDFRKHYFIVMPKLYVMGMITIVLSLFRNLSSDNPAYDPSNFMLGILFVIAMQGYLFRKDWAQYVCMSLCCVVSFYWTLTYKLG